MNLTPRPRAGGHAGRQIRILIAHDPASLRGKLETVEHNEPGPESPPV